MDRIDWIYYRYYIVGPRRIMIDNCITLTRLNHSQIATSVPIGYHIYVFLNFRHRI